MEPVSPRERLLALFRRNREISRSLFAMIPDEAYHARPIPLRHPIVFYEGHFAAFNVNTLAKRGHGRAGVDATLEELFERGIDPGSSADAEKATIAHWPSRPAIASYGARADALVEDLLSSAPLDRDDRPAMRRAEAAWTILEHELMHHETLLYMFHALDPARKSVPPRPLERSGEPPAQGTVRLPAGRATLGARRGEIPFGWDNEFEAVEVDVPAFEIDTDNVTNAEYLRFLEATGRPHPHFWSRRDGRWMWRTMRGEIDLPPHWPVWVTHDEASAYARWKGARLPSEAEYHRAAFGDPSGTERRFPWGDDEPDATRGNFGLQSWDPVPVGSFGAGTSAWGVRDLVGNGWEWTSTPFAPFPGFEPMPSYPQYSADFFDGKHYIIKGASPATARELVRRSFRNWFRADYPWVWAAFRCVY